MAVLRWPVLAVLAVVLERGDPDIAAHCRRVAARCATLLRAWGAPPDLTALVVAAARLHDLGKLTLPPALLAWPGPLTPAQRALMETHPIRGAEWLACVPGFAAGARMVRYHHEWWDGSGYPERRGGGGIPLGARVIAVADAYDALTYDRPYRRAFAPAHAQAILIAGRGRQWDPALVDLLLGQVGLEALGPGCRESDPHPLSRAA